MRGVAPSHLLSEPLWQLQCWKTWYLLMLLSLLSCTIFIMVFTIVNFLGNLVRLSPVTIVKIILIIDVHSFMHLYIF